MIKRIIVVLVVISMVTLSVPCVTAQEAVEVSSSAASAVLYEPSSGRVLFEQNAHTKRPMASTTKLMTALLAAECIPPNAVLTATWEAVNVEGSSMGLQVGDTVTREDLLYGLLLSSGNDAANVAALSMDDSLEEFAQRMNDRAQQIGMHDSVFVTPSGLDGDGHGASALDMALLAAEVLKNELLASVCAAKEATVTLGERQVTLSNHNRLLSEYDGAVGMKTGYTSKAGRCLVSAATREGVTLIAVTLDCANDWEEHKTLLDAGFALLEPVVPTPSIPSTLTVYGGERACVTPVAESPTLVLLKGDAAQLETVVSLPHYVWAPLAAGETLGTVTYCLRGAPVATVAITAGESVESAAPASRILRLQQLFRRLLQGALT